MKHLLFFGLVAFSLQCVAQITGLSVETVLEHDGVSIPELAGFTTYRIYVDVTSSTDYISAVQGDIYNPLEIQSDGEFFHSEIFSANYGQEVIPELYEFEPTIAFDSWFTIGAFESGQSGNVQELGMIEPLSTFNAGDGFRVDDLLGASWFNVFNVLDAADYSVRVSVERPAPVEHKRLNEEVLTFTVWPN